MRKNTMIKLLLGAGITTALLLCFTFVFMGFTFAAEETTQDTATTEEAVKTVTSAVEWIKSLSVDDIKGWIAGLIAFASGNVMIFISLGIALIKTRLTKIKDDKFYKELESKLNAEHQAKMEEFIKSIDNKLTDSQNIILEQVKNLDEKKKAEAESNIEVLKSNLENIKINLEK